MSQYSKVLRTELLIEAIKAAGLTVPAIMEGAFQTLIHGFDKLGDYFAMVEMRQDEYWEIYYGNPNFMGERVSKDQYFAFWQKLDDKISISVFMDVPY